MSDSQVVRVVRFGGQRIANPPAWGLKIKEGVELFMHGAGTSWLGQWYLDNEYGISWWHVPDDEVPDEVWVALAQWRLKGGG